MEQTILHGDNTLTVTYEQAEDGYRVTAGDSDFVLIPEFAQGGEFVVRIDGERKTVYAARDRDARYVFIDGRQYVFREESSDYNGTGAVAVSGDFISSPMPGTVIKINCAVGDAVCENDTLVVVEAMKMENMLRAPVSGTVSKINYGEGDLVDAGAPIVEIDSGK